MRYDSAIKDIIKNTQYSVENLEVQSQWLKSTIDKITELEDHMSINIENLEDIFDTAALIEKITKEIISRELEEIFEAITELIYEIDSYSENLSDSKAVEINDHYENLETVSLKFDQTNNDYENINEVIEHLEESLDLLNAMIG